MSCRICGKSNCVATFHSTEEQECFNKYNDFDNHTLQRLLVEGDGELRDKQIEIARLRGALERIEAKSPATITKWEKQYGCASCMEIIHIARQALEAKNEKV